MAISKALIASLLFSLLVLHLVEADQMTVVMLAKLGANHLPGQIFVKGRVEAAVAGATVFLQAPPVTTRPVPATPP
ncbi:hypothetical protein Dsin_003673 [Dipteronia sinensis]|uniref:Uncharacterized protein n=1 Tax=Dipteronia sinensis TaxID=43782 RepID=A0AAE0B9K6_9ROSI|nr:hypothetical protein Dsin_003673 [Dipteronia sinensis]